MYHVLDLPVSGSLAFEIKIRAKSLETNARLSKLAAMSIVGVI